MSGQITTTDETTLCQGVIEAEHYLIHHGRMWASGWTSQNIAAAGTSYFLMRTGDHEVHAAWQVEADKEVLVDLFENPTITVDGAAQAVLNVDRDSAAVTGVTCFALATVGALGTWLPDPHIIGDAASGGKVGGRARSATEWVFLEDEEYILRVVTLAVNTRVNMVWRFYEEL